MITFNRSQLVGAEFLDDDTIRFNGVQEDHIYGMEIDMDVRIADGEILAIQGVMKRYTNPVCPAAVPVLQRAVGISVREEGWCGIRPVWNGSILPANSQTASPWSWRRLARIVSDRPYQLS